MATRYPFRNEAVEDGGVRPGRSTCECDNEKHGDDGCLRIGSMHDGWFLCRWCVHHHNQWKEQKED